MSLCLIKIEHNRDYLIELNKIFQLSSDIPLFSIQLDFNWKLAFKSLRIIALHYFALLQFRHKLRWSENWLLQKILTRLKTWFNDCLNDVHKNHPCRWNDDVWYIKWLIAIPALCISSHARFTLWLILRNSFCYFATFRISLAGFNHYILLFTFL